MKGCYINIGYSCSLTFDAGMEEGKHAKFQISIKIVHTPQRYLIIKGFLYPNLIKGLVSPNLII